MLVIILLTVGSGGDGVYFDYETMVSTASLKLSRAVLKRPSVRESGQSCLDVVTCMPAPELHR